MLKVVSFGHWYLDDCLCFSLYGRVTTFGWWGGGRGRWRCSETLGSFPALIHYLSIHLSIDFSIYLFLVITLAKLIITWGSLHLLFLFLESFFSEFLFGYFLLVLYSTKSFLIILTKVIPSYLLLTASFKIFFPLWNSLIYFYPLFYFQSSMPEYKFHEGRDIIYFVSQCIIKTYTDIYIADNSYTIIY